MGNDRTSPERETKREVDYAMKLLMFYITRPKRWIPSAMEYGGIALILYGLYKIAPIGALIGLGALLLLLAQGLNRRNE